MTLVNSYRFMVILCSCALLTLIFTFYQRKCLQPGDRYNYWLLEKHKGEESNQKQVYYESELIINSLGFKQIPKIQQRGEYWVFYNLLVSTKTFSQFESITYITHGDFTFLDNLEPLLERWKGPISIALYAPGDDFNRTIETIHYLRDCTTNLIGEFVTFHVFFKGDELPEKIPNLNETFDTIYNCDIAPSFKSIQPNETYKALNELPYPINVARNIAKELSQTHFVLVSDIELYPSVDIIKNFLEMINRTRIFISNPNPMVFPLNLFEVEEDAEIPATKTELLAMLENKTAINFHQKVCARCHNTPKYNEWVNTTESKRLNVFYVGKRMGEFNKWEPIYIGSKNDPSYDERLTWEGKSDKMSQAYVLCVKNYDMMILDNAFLVHKPGIKFYKHDPKRDVYVRKTMALKNVIRKELDTLFGVKEGCVI